MVASNKILNDVDRNPRLPFGILRDHSEARTHNRIKDFISSNKMFYCLLTTKLGSLERLTAFFRKKIYFRCSCYVTEIRNDP